MELEGAGMLARDLARLDEGQYALVAEWMIGHGWTEPLDPVERHAHHAEYPSGCTGCEHLAAALVGRAPEWMILGREDTIPRHVLLREIEDASNAGIRPIDRGELRAWNYLLDHFAQFVKGWPFPTSPQYLPASSRCGCGHMPHPGLICGYPVPTPGNQPPIPKYCDCEG